MEGLGSRHMRRRSPNRSSGSSPSDPTAVGCRNRVDSGPGPTISMIDRNAKAIVMGQTARHHLIFETAGGFCGIAWNNVGITRFQLPTKSAEAAERTLLRRLPGAERGAPTPEVVEAVAAVKRYFEGEETDFSGFKLDLGGEDPFFEQIHAAARRVGWGRTTTYGTLVKELGAGPEAARDV